MRKRSVERLPEVLLVVSLSIAGLTWIAERFVTPEWIPILRGVMVITLLIALPVGFIVARQSRPITPTKDPEFDHALDKLLEEEDRRKKKTSSG